MGINGVSVNKFDDHALFVIDSLSDEVKRLIRENFSAYCHGADLAVNGGLMFKYEATLSFFLEVFDSKSEDIQKGLIGELIIHVILKSLYKGFEVVSPYLNLEEKSIKKGFDLLLYEVTGKELWITEVKSGGKRKNKCQNQTISVLLADARDDLKYRLSNDELNYWRNAIHAVRSAVEGTKDYKDVIVSILQGEGEMVLRKSSTGADNSVIIVGVLFHDVAEQVELQTIQKFSERLNKKSPFKKSVVIGVQKGTIEKIVDFLRSESKV
ncbi:Hachiman antiphage defense system protein HamA [Metapseudomonas otitidis]|jgi:hypothetical protein